MILDHCYPYIYCDLGYQSNMHLITLAQVMANCCINPWWKIMRRLLRAWQLEHKPWINYRGVNLTSVGLKRLAWENLPPRWSFARYALQEQIKHASRNSTWAFSLLPWNNSIDTAPDPLFWMQQSDSASPCLKLAVSYGLTPTEQQDLLCFLLKCDYPSSISFLLLC